MVVSSPVPSPTASKASAVGSQVLEPSPANSLEPGPAAHVESNPAPRPNCGLRSRGMSQFPPRLSRDPRPKNGPHAHINLPQLPLQGRSSTKVSRPIPSLRTVVAAEEQDDDVLTLEMRPARLHVSSLWHRLRFSGFSPMASQRRSTWKPGKPRRGRPEGTKGAGSRSI